MTLTAKEIEAILLTAIHQTNLSRRADEQLEETADATIFGPASTLDSVGLVGLLADIEDVLADRGVSLSLSGERAMYLSILKIDLCGYLRIA